MGKKKFAVSKILYLRTGDCLASKRGLMVHHHKPECFMGEKKDYCIQCQGHSEG